MIKREIYMSRIRPFIGSELVKVMTDNFPKYVVSLDEFDMSRNGIKHYNMRDFLNSSEWQEQA